MLKQRIVSRRNFFKKFAAAGSSGLILGTSIEMQTARADASTEERLSLKLIENARIVLESSCRAKAGESLLIVADDKLLPYGPAFAQAAVELSMIPAVFDIRHYISSQSYKDGSILKPLKEAIMAADIVIENLADTWVPNRPGYGRLLGDPDLHDKSLTAERRWMILQCNDMEEWDPDPVEIAAIRTRTVWLMELLKSAKTGRVTSSAGTDFTFDLGRNSMCTPVLGIIPFYGEVAVTPGLENTSGTFVVDGPTQRKVRPTAEMDREPLRITVEGGRAVDMSGDPVQLKRLKEFIASGDPPADAIDEVGLLTTNLRDNDKYYWSDGTHGHDRIHIALGNNVRRDKVVHGPQHMDGEVCKPTVEIEGRVIIKDGIFQDSVMEGR